MSTLKSLILSGGGGRGAFHAGVYKYLMQTDKPGVDAEHAGVWDPQVVVGTSIGAVNGAAIVQGFTPAELESFWLSLEEKDVQGLPPGMRGLARWLVRKIFGAIMDEHLSQVPPGQATSPEAKVFWPSLPFLPAWFGELLSGRWINLLDTGPLRNTILTRMKFDPDKLAASKKALLIAATNVQTGKRVMFSNRKIFRCETGELRTDIHPGIGVERIIASCSIPLIYPWIFDAETNAFYWDGALVANTPLGSAFDAFGDVPADAPAEVMVVLMTPWRTDTLLTSDSARSMPNSFSDAITRALDWALLASFRERLRLIEAYNRLADQERTAGPGPYCFRRVKVVIVAPENFLSAARIIDYDQDVSRGLIDMGYAAAENAFRQQFPL